MTTKYQAEINAQVTAIREWQRGAISWAEAMRRADLTAVRQAHLKSKVGRTTTEDGVRQLLTETLPE